MKTKLLFSAIIFSLVLVFGTSNSANAQCQAGFTTTVTGGTVQFTNTSSSAATPNCYWTFGDMSSIVVVGGNMTHTYTIAGTYQVCLTITDTVNTCTNTFCDSVTVLVACLGFNTSVTSVDESAPAACDGSAVGVVSGGTAPYTYSWSNSATTPSISNLCAGTYTLTATDMNACVSYDIITINSPVVCTANFTYAVVGNTVNLLNTSSDTLTSTFNWNFGDANTSSLTNPGTHTYTSAGTYTILLAMGNTFLGCSDSIFQTITVGGPTSCATTFTMVQDSFNLLQWYVYPTITGQAPFTYLWDFGDTTTSTLAYPTHNYSNTSHHIVCLTVTDANLCVSTFCDSSMAHRMTAEAYASSGMQFLTVVNVADGIQEQNEIHASVFPNPVTDLITVSFNKSVSGTIRITDLAGKTVYEIAMNGVQKQIDLSFLSQGIYSINLSGDNVNWNKKIAVVR